MAQGDAREGKWRGNWRMEWVASTLTLPRNVVYPELLTLMRTPRLPAVDWTDAPADLNGLIRFGERLNLVSARVPSRFKRTIQKWQRRSVIHLKYLRLVLGMFPVRVWTRAPTLLLEDDELLGAFAKLRKATMSVVSVRPSAWNSSIPTGRIFMKFYIWVFFENLLKKFNFH
jgi:hypothetical protein